MSLKMSRISITFLSSCCLTCQRGDIPARVQPPSFQWAGSLCHRPGPVVFAKQNHGIVFGSKSVTGGNSSESETAPVLVPAERAMGTGSEQHVRC